MTVAATGRLEVRDDQQVLVLGRAFQAPITDVWAAVTESDRMARWVGTWTGQPTSGSVAFRMTAEGDDAPAQTFEILSCEPPRTLEVRTADDAGAWELGFALEDQQGITTVEFTHAVHQPDALESIGPGWEYYLDRLVAAETGGDPSTVAFDRDYYPALSEYYAALARTD